MIKSSITMIFIASMISIVLIGCEVEQTQEGKMPKVDVEVTTGNLPEYEVVKTKEGNMPDVDVEVKSGQLPKYDIDAPDIVVGKKEVEVEVPDVDVKMKKETISVPVVGVDIPDDKDS